MPQNENLAWALPYKNPGFAPAIKKASFNVAFYILLHPIRIICLSSKDLHLHIGCCFSVTTITINLSFESMYVFLNLLQGLR